MHFPLLLKTPDISASAFSSFHPYSFDLAAFSIPVFALSVDPYIRQGIFTPWSGHV